MNKEQQRLIHAIIYFTETMNFSKSKLFKMLYLLDHDSEHSVTGLEYVAGEYGMYPKSLNDDWVSSPPWFIEAFVKVNRHGTMTLKPKIKFDESVFSVFQRKQLTKISKLYFLPTASEIKIEGLMQ